MSNRRNSPYPAKSTSDDDDATVESDSPSVDDTTPAEPVAKQSFATKRKNRLTAISAKYDIDGSGELDEAEQAMRDHDVSNRGHLTNEEIYAIVKQQLEAKEKAGHMKKIIAGLICFVVLLALSNLGTSLAAAFLAQDLKADNDAGEEAGPPAMRIAATGEIAAAQSTANKYTGDPMSDEEFYERRRLVVQEMEDDPHSHQHRRELRRKNVATENCNGMGYCDGQGGRRTYDVMTIDIDKFDQMQRECGMQKNVNLEQRFGDSTRNVCVCSRGSSMVVKEKKTGKKGNNSKKDKKDKGNGKKGNGKKNRDKEVIIEREDGNTFHASCEGKKCHCGGGVLLGRKGDACRLNRDECDSNLVCEKSTNKKDKKLRNSNDKFGVCQKPTKDSGIVIRTGNDNNGKSQDWCDLTKKKACSKGYWCSPGEDYYASFSSVTVTTRNRSATKIASDRSVPTDVGTCQMTVGRGQSCWDDGMCGKDNFCDFGNNNSGNCADIRFIGGGRTGGGGGGSGWYKSYHPDVHGQCMNNGNNAPGDPTYNNWKECCDAQLPWRSYMQCAPNNA